jgi:hypothetical protein
MADRISLRAYAKRRGCVLRAVQNAIESGRIAAASTRDPVTGYLNGVDPELADRLWARNTDPVEAARSARPSPGGSSRLERRYGGAGLSGKAEQPEGIPGDGCGKTVADCALRFQDAAPLPPLPSIEYKPLTAASVRDPAGASAPAGDRQLAQQTTEGQGQQLPLEGSEAPPRAAASADYFDHRAKREKWLAEIAEADYLEKIGLLTSVAEIERTQFDIWRRVRDSIVKAFDRADGTLAAIPQAAPVRGRLRADLRAILNELSESLALESAEGAAECAEALL